MKNILEYNDTVLLPAKYFQTYRGDELVEVMVLPYKRFYAIDSKDLLSNCTYKVTLVEKSTVGEEYPNETYVYFSDIINVIKKHNPHILVLKKVWIEKDDEIFDDGGIELYTI